MASKIGLSYRKEGLDGRLRAAASALAERVGVDPPAGPTPGRDPAARAVEEAEQMAAFLERVAGTLVEQGVEGGEPLTFDLDRSFAVGVEVDLTKAYALYDADPRVHGPDDFEAFSDAILAAMGGADVGTEGAGADVVDLGTTVDRVEETGDGEDAIRVETVVEPAGEGVPADPPIPPTAPVSEPAKPAAKRARK